jgi:hypothetical protein
MKNTLPGCLLLLGAFAGGFLLGRLAALVVEALTGNRDIASAVGAGAWILSVVLFVSYGSLLLYSAGLVRDDTAPTSVRRRWQKRREESKLQTAELRVGFVFAMVGGACADYAGASTWLIIAFAASFAALGGLIGHDIKRRAGRLREKRRARGADE